MKSTLICIYHFTNYLMQIIFYLLQKHVTKYLLFIYLFIYLLRESMIETSSDKKKNVQEE